MENNNYDRDKQYLTEDFKNIFICNFESVILNTSLLFLKC